jgi:hypothetical protein
MDCRFDVLGVRKDENAGAPNQGVVGEELK